MSSFLKKSRSFFRKFIHYDPTWIDMFRLKSVYDYFYRKNSRSKNALLVQIIRNTVKLQHTKKCGVSFTLVEYKPNPKPN